MKTKTISVVAGALAAALSAGATDVSIEGQYFKYDVVQPSVETNCLVRFYRTENASSEVYLANNVRFATDADGRFVIHALAPDFVELPDTFWVGVQPPGYEELAPRFRVAPVPFAFAADEVQLISTAKEFELTGVATIDRLDVSGNVEAEDLVVATNSVVKTRNLKLDSAKIMSLDIPNGGLLGLFNAKGATPSFDYDTFSAEKEGSVEARIEESSFISHDHSRDNSADYSYTFSGDGFLLVAIKANPKKCPAPRLSVRVGGTVVYDRAVGANRGDMVKRFMTIPYRSGEEVVLGLTAVGGGEIPYRQQDNYKSNIGVKLRLVKFGRD